MSSAPYEFESDVTRWQARSDADWFFATVPADVSDEISARQGPLRRGFGAVAVRVRIGGSQWRTSIFPGSSGDYSLPLKRSVRDAEGISPGDRIRVSLELLDAG